MKRPTVYTNLLSKTTPRALGGLLALFIIGFLVASVAVLGLVGEQRNERAAGGSVPGNVCDRYASVDGSDNAAGTSHAPFRTAQKLAISLKPGETGCLGSATYTEPDDTLTISSGGARGRPVVLRSEPGERASFSGQVYVAANYVTIQDMSLNGATAPTNANGYARSSPTVNGDGVKLMNNDITNEQKGICVLAGSQGTAKNLLIKGNRIHGCGVLPRTNHHHGIYVNTANNAVIVGNLIYDNADRGIQLYPDARGTLIEGNIIDGNGVGLIISGRGDRASNTTVVKGNVIANSTKRWNVESSWNQTSQVGYGNLVHHNCVWATNQNDYYNQNGGITPKEEGFDAYDNLVAEPMYVDREARNFELRDDSPCRNILDERTSAAGEAPPTGLMLCHWCASFSSYYTSVLGVGNSPDLWSER
jgi:parallel beta-helix repeat protein